MSHIWQQLPVCNLQQSVRILPFRQPCNDGVPLDSLHQREHGILVARPHDGVHLPVPVSWAVCLVRPFVDAYLVPDGDMAAHGPFAVLEPVAAVFVQVAALCLVLADVLIT